MRERSAVERRWFVGFAGIFLSWAPSVLARAAPAGASWARARGDAGPRATGLPAARGRAGFALPARGAPELFVAASGRAERGGRAAGFAPPLVRVALLGAFFFESLVEAFFFAIDSVSSPRKARGS